MINKYSDIPLYCQLKNMILEKIESKEFSEDSKIPSEHDLCEMYNISRPTVRQAISDLTNNGFLYKEKGKGTFVAKSKINVDIKNYSGFTDSILDSQVPGEKEIISTKIVKSSDHKTLGELFGIAFSQKIDFAEIRYTSTQNGDIFALNTSYIPLNLFPDIIQEIAEKKPSYEIMRNKYPLIPVRTKSSLEIVFSEQSDAQYLQVQPGQPIIRIENMLYSKSSQIVEYIVSKYRADKSRLMFESSK